MVAPCHLGQHRTPGGATDTPPEPVDEEHLQRHVRGAGCDKDHERTAEAPDPAQEALAQEALTGQRDQPKDNPKAEILRYATDISPTSPLLL
jgi:hypothetical protein